MAFKMSIHASVSLTQFNVCSDPTVSRIGQLQLIPARTWLWSVLFSVIVLSTVILYTIWFMLASWTGVAINKLQTICPSPELRYNEMWLLWLGWSVRSRWGEGSIVFWATDDSALPCPCPLSWDICRNCIMFTAPVSYKNCYTPSGKVAHATFV
jgi:hypothetical protein